MTVSRSERQVQVRYRVFWAWQEEAEIRWLEQMALEGWALAGVKGIRYTFVQTAPQRVVYRLDFQTGPTERSDEYRELLEEAGWEWVTRQGNWIYLRRPFDAQGVPELYTDNASRLARYRSQLRVLVIALLPPLYLLGIYPLIFGWMKSGWGRFLQAAALLLTVVLVYAIGRIAAVVRQLDSDPKE